MAQLRECPNVTLSKRVKDVIKANNQFSQEIEYKWDEEKHIFTSPENDLCLDFRGFSEMSFEIGHRCMVRCDDNCSIQCGDWCVFDTYEYCTFKAGDNCLFDTADYCAFDTKTNCTFIVGHNCTFKTGRNSIVRNRFTNRFKTLPHEENYYDEENTDVIHNDEDFDIIVFRNGKNLDFTVDFRDVSDLKTLKRFLSEEEYNNLLKEIFARMT